ncbi:MAG: SpoIIE family protein phosphatase [Bacteroidales bacterium]|nr:SpoIIE family protein phosphatase [Bacteroidales bacterium]
MFNRDVFIDVEHHQMCKNGNLVCGDVFLSKRLKEENRTIVVLADGLGSGIKANVLASMTAGMIVNFMILNEPIDRVTKTIMNTLPVDQYRKIGYSTFTIIDIESDGETRIIEYGNPPTLVFRNGKVEQPVRQVLELPFQTNLPQKLYFWNFQAGKEDRIISMSDGVSQSGIGRMDMPFGWDMEKIECFISDLLLQKPDINARDLSRRLTNQARINDILKPQDDISCGVIHFSTPRKLLLCTGPPYNACNDKLLAQKAETFDGARIICGGTTAEIVSRELHREIEVQMETARAGLPPLSTIEGIDLVAEGILTLGRVSTLLEKGDINQEPEDSPAGEILKLFLQHDEINLLVGTKVNDAHQDPTLPVELEIRRNVMKRIARLLETKYLKRVFVEYL